MRTQAGKLRDPLRFWWCGGFCGFAGFRRRASSGGATGKIFIRNGEYVVLCERFSVASEFFPQRGNLFSCHRGRVVAPLAALVCENIGNFLVGQRFVPWL